MLTARLRGEDAGRVASYFKMPARFGQDQDAHHKSASAYLLHVLSGRSVITWQNSAWRVGAIFLRHTGRQSMGCSARLAISFASS